MPSSVGARLKALLTQNRAPPPNSTTTAVAQHVIQLDCEHSEPRLVAAMAFLVLALAASYIGVRALLRKDTEGRKSGR